MNRPMSCCFQSPSPEFGPVPFWWWVGEPLDRDRLVWQLDRLKERGVRHAIVSYNHHADGAPNLGEPAVFSLAWWDLLRVLLADCRARGMQLSFQDYALLNPILQEIGATHPDMAGGGELREVHIRLAGGQSVRLAAEPACTVLGAYAYRLATDRACAEESQDLTAAVRDGRLAWPAPAGDWLVSLVYIKPNPFDPLHAESGQRVIARFYAPFECEIGEYLGSTFPVSFQDELDFGSPMPRWSRGLAAEFFARKGYALAPLLPALWHDLGAITPKVRIDYADVVTTLLEERYFRPIFEWHEARGLLFGHDNCGRGGIAAGRRAYGDPFRTMRWYSAPGTDDPKLGGARAFQGLKVNSSIAHLYGRPRVWNECFHSSGWGATPAEMVAALNEDFVYGATVVNLHGLYYSTCGGWWEWAPPDFHFRQPYWQHSSALNNYVTRLCQTLSAGVHVCDVAILYPITALEGGLNARLPVEAESDIPVSEWQAGKIETTRDAAEAAAFGIGRSLVTAGLDFDFVDFQSLERATIADGRINVSGESYRALVLPCMSAVRFSTLEVAREFRRAGGVVIAYGCLPVASERAGADDPAVDALVREIFGGDKMDHSARGVLVRGGYAGVVVKIADHIGRDFYPADTGLMALHRRDATHDTYFVFNPAARAVAGAVTFRAAGGAERWDAWTGEAHPLPCEPTPAGPRVFLRLESGEGQLVVFDRMRVPPAREGFISAEANTTAAATLVLDGPWEFTLAPTMDNRFGDFRLPPHAGLLGPEARRFRHAEEPADEPSARAALAAWPLPAFDDAAWRQTTVSYGQRFWKIGPLLPGADLAAVEAACAALHSIDPGHPVVVEGREYCWEPYEFSLRWGIEDDPFLKDWAGGPHGLKGVVPDEFIDLYCAEPGATWLLWTAVATAEARVMTFEMGSRSRYAAWLNGRPVLAQDEELPPGRQSVWNLPHYQCAPRQSQVDLRAGANPLLLRFVQPAGQRTRAYAAFALAPVAEQREPALRWFAQLGHPQFDPRPRSGGRAGWYRFAAPPALQALTVVSRAPLRAWSNGVECAMAGERRRADGRREARFMVTAPARGNVLVSLRVEPLAGSYGGDALPEPVLLECGSGELALGDWSAHGLATYSGAAWYRRTLGLSAEEAERADTLDLGRVAVTAAVRINGREVAILLAPPWQVPVAGRLRPGENRLEVQVTNTLANHYSVGMPTPYVFAGQTVSGLLGPVALRFKSATPAD